MTFETSRTAAICCTLCLFGLLTSAIRPTSAQSKPARSTQAEAAIPAEAEGPLFELLPASAGIDFTHFNGMSGELYFVETVGAGAALFDYDNDGDLDVYLVQGTMLGAPSASDGDGDDLAGATFQPAHSLPLTDRLYRNDLEVGADGTRSLKFTDVTEAAGLLRTGATGYGMGVIAGDYDNDGWTDLYVTNAGANALLKNRGDGTFEDRTQASGTDDTRWSVPAIFVDYDRDGWLDLYVGNYVAFSVAKNKTCLSETGARDYCNPLSYEPIPNRLFRNRGNGTFEDVSTRSGIASFSGNTLGALATDFDGDGWLDLYVANDLMPNELWINAGDGTFVNDSLFAGAAVNSDGKAEASMGVSAADIDGDGDDDLIVTHLTRETNTLYRNEGGGLFRDATQDTGLAGPSFDGTGFGTAWFDYDNDGQLDLVVANGAVRTIEAQAREKNPYPLNQPNQLFRNLNGRFVETTDQAGTGFDLSEVSRGTAIGDLDNDGDSDLVITNSTGKARIFVNQVGQAARWIGLRLVEPDRGGRDALGARAIIRARPATSEGASKPEFPTRTRKVATDGSFASASDPRIVVGLGGEMPTNTLIDVDVVWADGSKETFRALAIDRYHRLERGSATTEP